MLVLRYVAARVHTGSAREGRVGPRGQDAEGPDVAAVRHLAADLWVQPRRPQHLRVTHPQAHQARIVH
eukprot:19166-Eustigmatos_ZCMA.PRE.1